MEEQDNYYFRWIVRKPEKGSIQWKLLEKGLLVLSYLFNFYPILITEITFVSLILVISVIAFVYKGDPYSVLSIINSFWILNALYGVPVCSYVLFDIISTLIAVRKKTDYFEAKQELILSNCNLESAVTEGCVVKAFVICNSLVSDKFLYIDCIGIWKNKT